MRGRPRLDHRRCHHRRCPWSARSSRRLPSPPRSRRGGAVGSPVSAARSAASASAPIPPPVHHGTLRIAGQPRDGALVTASGLAWHAPRLPRGMKLLSFEVAYTWQSCAPSGRRCTTAADSTATPFAARQYRAGHADTGRRLRVTETAAEVVQTKARNFTFKVLRRSVRRLAGVPVRAYQRHQRPVSYFRNGTPERHTASAEEYFGVSRAALQHRGREAQPAVPGGPGRRGGRCRPITCSTPGSWPSARTR